MKSKTKIAMLLASSAFVFVGVVQASEQYGDAFGGSGGIEFDFDSCNTGSMSGMRVRSADKVDAVGRRCYKDNPINGPLHGGPGGSLSSWDCPGGTPFVKGINGRYGRVIDRLGLLCTNSTKISSSAGTQFGGTGGSAFSFSCGNGFSVKGFHGQSGRLVDRLGVICSNRSETSSGL